MSKHKHRVVVQLTEDGSALDTRKSSTIRIKKHHPARNLKANVDVLNEKTLVLSIKNNLQPNRMQEMHFDYVGKQSDPHTSAEISSLIDQLLVQCHNCCLLKFSPIKVSQSPVICNRLVNEIEKRLQMLRATISSIRIEYFDVQKYHMINLITDVTKKKRRPYIQNEFANILELHKWFQKEYIPLWSAGLGHDCLDVHFTFVDINHCTHNVKLSLFNLYLSKMDLDTKNILCDFFRNLGNEKPIKNCLLTDCLKEYFNDNKAWRTWMIFDVPKLKFAGNVTDDMLQLANAAFKGAQTSTNESKESMESNLLYSGIFLTERNMSAKNRVIGDGANHNRKSKNILNTNLPFSTKDLNGLSSWYCKIEEKFATAMRALELFYSHKYETKIRRICGDIKQLMRNIEKGKVRHTKPLKSNLPKRDLQTSFTNYKASILAFRNLAREIEYSNYSDILRVYLKTKNYELAQQTIQLKIQQLEDCQQRLTDTISDEVNALNTLKKNTPILETESTTSTMTPMENKSISEDLT